MISENQIKAIVTLMNQISISDGYDKTEGYATLTILEKAGLMKILTEMHPEFKTEKGAFSSYLSNDIIIPYPKACSILRDADEETKELAQVAFHLVCIADGQTSDIEKRKYNEIAQFCGWKRWEDKWADNKNEEKKEDDEEDQWLDSDGDTVVDNIMYDLYGDGTAMARLFEEDEEREQITIPATINYNGKTYTVTSFAISEGEYSELNLPSTIKTIDGEAFSEMNRETRDKLVVNLAADAQVLYKGKAFYSKDKKHLTNTSLVPDCKEYTVTDGVESIWNNAFAAHDEIEILNVPPSVKQIDSPFSYKSGLKIVNIFNHEGNVKFYDEEPGVESFPKGTTINYHPRKESQELKQNTQPKGQLLHTSPSNNPTKKGFKDRWHDLPIKYKIISILSILLPFILGFWAIIITLAVLCYIWIKS